MLRTFDTVGTLAGVRRLSASIWEENENEFLNHFTQITRSPRIGIRRGNHAARLFEQR